MATPKQERRRERRALDTTRGYSPSGALGLVVCQSLTKIGVKTLYLPTELAAYQTYPVGPSSFAIVPGPEGQQAGHFKITVEALP